MKPKTNEKEFRIGVLTPFEVMKPNDPIHAPYNDLMRQMAENRRMAERYESSWRASPLLPLILGLLTFAATFVIIALIFAP